MNATTKVRITTLDEALEFLNRIETINFGGCGVAALAIVRWMKKQGARLPSKPIVAYYEVNNPHNWHAHFCFAWHGQHLDASGEVRASYYGLEVSDFMSERQLLKELNDPTEDWNADFDRAQWVPYIAQNLGIDLSDVQINGRLMEAHGTWYPRPVTA